PLTLSKPWSDGFVNFHAVAKRPLACSQSRLTGRSRLSSVSAYAFTSCSANGAAPMASRSGFCTRWPRSTLQMMTNLRRSRRFHPKPASVSNEVCNPAKNNFLHDFFGTGSRLLIWVAQLSGSPAPPAPSPEPRGRRGGLPAHIVHRLAWRSAGSNRAMSWLWQDHKFDRRVFSRGHSRGTTRAHSPTRTRPNPSPGAS